MIKHFESQKVKSASHVTKEGFCETVSGLCVGFNWMLAAHEKEKKICRSKREEKNTGNLALLLVFRSTTFSFVDQFHSHLGADARQKDVYERDFAAMTGEKDVPNVLDLEVYQIQGGVWIPVGIVLRLPRHEVLRNHGSQRRRILVS